ncbi:MAG TPA: potassium channel protein [Bacteroidia bacterium]|nr:potassium channel protein [Bacteroidia bacterium]
MLGLFRDHHFFKKLYIAAGLILFILLAGISGYMLIEHYRFLDAVYMTIITAASVGFQEVNPLSDAGKVFTSLLIIMSLLTLGYSISIITTYIIEGEFQTYFKHQKVKSEINKLDHHVIVCGYGRNGRQACEQLKSGNKKFLVIESNAEIIEQIRADSSILFIEGNATNDEVLIEASITKASALISTLPHDADNVFVVLTAREMNPKLKIISRASDDASENKLKRAGANNVIMPDKIGGTHMAALVTKPDVLEFLDYITGKINIRLEEIFYSNLSDRLKNKTIRELEIRNKTGANIIGFKKGDGEYIINPEPDTVMQQDSKLFVLGTQEQVTKLLEILAS